MRKSVLALSLLGIIVACFVAYLGAYLALFTLRNDPSAQIHFFIGLVLNIAAAIVLAAGIFAEDAIKARFKTLAFVNRTYRLWIWTPVLGLIALSVPVIGEAFDSFHTMMAFTAFPCGLVAMVCTGAIIKELSRHFQGKKPTT